MSQQQQPAPDTRISEPRWRLHLSRRPKLKMLDELMIVGLSAGALYLVLVHVAGTSGTTAGYAAVFAGGVLVGGYLRPWGDRVARRLGVRIVRSAPRRGTRTSGRGRGK
ncbi:hypothetical protein [Actinomadura sp. DC4]|uniref:hypothetical protein n=1 Tax=Actinomadura sp. DC4 TaxID=3055069 RepID=UPI0025B21CB0|nr:hypothetical protein [Actinomadura sp. DC4]MDN3356111.1 hypothetical protein [Actinomadura sp. DC4]